MIFNVTGGGGGAGATLTVNAPAGVTATVYKETKSKTRTVDANGYAVFKGLETGTWTLTITDGEQTSTVPVVIKADYSAVIAFFAATISITYPAGSTCTCSDGTTTFTAPDTTGVWECIVPNAGTWTISCTDGTDSTEETVEITTDGQSESVELNYREMLIAELNATGWARYSEGVAGEYVRCGDRGFTRTSILPAIWCWSGSTDGFYGWCLIAASDDALSYGSVTSYGDMSIINITTPEGNNAYVGYMGSSWNNGASIAITSNGQTHTLAYGNMGTHLVNVTTKTIDSELVGFVDELLF